MTHPADNVQVKQYNQELCISSITRCFTKRLQSRPLKTIQTYLKDMIIKQNEKS